MTTSKSPPLSNQSSWVVLKFGGTSVSSAGNWQTIASQIRDGVKNGTRMMIVHSALAEVSNQLEIIADASDDFDTSSLLKRIWQQHRSLAEAFDLDVNGILASAFEDLKRDIANSKRTGGTDPRTHAKIVAHGELMATRLGHAILASMGIELDWLDARSALQSEQNLVRSDLQNYVSATCSFDPDQSLMQTLNNVQCLISM